MNNEPPRCRAKTRAGELCKKWPITGMTRCRLHGGKSLFWFAHPSYKKGEYSKYSYAGVRRKIDAAERAAFKRAYHRMMTDPMYVYRLHERRPASPLKHVAPVRCGAKNRQGNPCQKWPIRGRNRCRNHGGKSLRGVDSPSFKNGRHSKLLPRNLMGKMLAYHGLRR